MNLQYPYRNFLEIQFLSFFFPLYSKSHEYFPENYLLIKIFKRKIFKSQFVKNCARGGKKQFFDGH